MATYPLATLAAQVSAAGITAPAYSDIYQSLQASFKAIYGTDAYIDPDSQDGQLLAVVAKAISDSNDAAIAAYNNYSPASSYGTGLSNQVKINGISRLVATKGQAVLRLVGVIGTIITEGVASDANGNRWLVPSPSVIPAAGFLDVTATAEKEGAIEAPVGSITQIVTPTLGWQTVTNISAASPGAPVENDATLRRRQTISTALPSQSVLDGIQGAIASVEGVTQVIVYENDSNTTDANTLPPHSIAAVTIGGAAADIAAAIFLKKTVGCYTYGSTVQVVADTNGIPYNIRFSYSIPVPLAMAVTIKALTGYTVAVGDKIKQALADYVNALGIGKRSDLGRLYLPAQLFGSGTDYQKFEVNAITQAIKPASPTAADIDIPWNSHATLSVADIALTVT